MLFIESILLVKLMIIRLMNPLIIIISTSYNIYIYIVLYYNFKILL